jgi:hypothetical protein
LSADDALEQRLRDVLRRSMLLAREVSDVAQQARSFAIVASLAATRRDGAVDGLAALLERVGAIAFRAEASVKRAAALIGECTQAPAEAGSLERARARIASAIAELDQFSGTVSELRRTLKLELESVPGAVHPRPSERPTLRALPLPRRESSPP